MRVDEQKRDGDDEHGGRDHDGHSSSCRVWAEQQQRREEDDDEVLLGDEKRTEQRRGEHEPARPHCTQEGGEKQDRDALGPSVADHGDHARRGEQSEPLRERSRFVPRPCRSSAAPRSAGGPAIRTSPRKRCPMTAARRMTGRVGEAVGIRPVDGVAGPDLVEVGSRRVHHARIGHGVGVLATEDRLARLSEDQLHVDVGDVVEQPSERDRGVGDDEEDRRARP